MVAAMAEKYGEWHAMAYCEEEAMAVGADKWHMACFIVTREEGGDRLAVGAGTRA
jgi:hypothetical protein